MHDTSPQPDYLNVLKEIRGMIALRRDRKGPVSRHLLSDIERKLAEVIPKDHVTIVIHGPVGVGKTRIQQIIARALKIELGVSVQSRDLLEDTALGALDEPLPEWELERLRENQYILLETHNPVKESV